MAARRPPGKRMRRGMQPAANVRLKPPIKNGCGLPADEARSVPGGRRTTTTMTGTGVIAGEGSETLRHKHGARRRAGGRRPGLRRQHRAGTGRAARRATNQRITASGVRQYLVTDGCRRGRRPRAVTRHLSCVHHTRRLTDVCHDTSRPAPPSPPNRHDDSCCNSTVYRFYNSFFILPNVA